jgi:hypothetical protein
MNFRSGIYAALIGLSFFVGAKVQSYVSSDEVSKSVIQRDERSGSEYLTLGGKNYFYSIGDVSVIEAIRTYEEINELRKKTIDYQREEINLLRERLGLELIENE